jgi:hypothetical protein
MHKSNFISKNLPFDFEKSWFENIENETETENFENSVLSLATPDGGVDGAPVPKTGVPDSHKKTEIKKPYLSIISPEPRYTIIEKNIILSVFLFSHLLLNIFCIYIFLAGPNCL